jgi:hypothetical protein
MIETNAKLVNRFRVCKPDCCRRYRRIKAAKFCGCCGKKLVRWTDIVAEVLGETPTLNKPNTE